MSWMDGDVKEEAVWDVVFDMAAKKNIEEICLYKYAENLLWYHVRIRELFYSIFHSVVTVVYITWGRETRSYISANNCWISVNDSKDQAEIYMLIIVQ